VLYMLSVLSRAAIVMHGTAACWTMVHVNIALELKQALHITSAPPALAVVQVTSAA
jgi:hypothetical protein